MPEGFIRAVKPLNVVIVVIAVILVKLFPILSAVCVYLYCCYVQLTTVGDRNSRRFSRNFLQNGKGFYQKLQFTEKRANKTPRNTKCFRFRQSSQRGEQLARVQRVETAGQECSIEKDGHSTRRLSDSGFGAQFSTKPRRRLRNFAPIIMELMNPLYLKSHLWSCGLLSNKDVKYLDENLLKERQNNYFFRNHLEISYIIRKVDQRGSKGIQQFISCLEAENEHLGHKDLADILKHKVCSVCQTSSVSSLVCKY